MVRDLRVNIVEIGKCLVVSVNFYNGINLFGYIGERKWDHVQGEFFCLNFREVQYVAKKLGEVMAGYIQRVYIPLLLGVQRGLQKKFRDTYNSVHWSANLMAHLGQEFTLAAAGILGLFLTFFQGCCSIVNVVLKIVLVLLEVLGSVVNCGEHLADGFRKFSYLIYPHSFWELFQCIAYPLTLCDIVGDTCQSENWTGQGKRDDDSE